MAAKFCLLCLLCFLMANLTEGQLNVRAIIRELGIKARECLSNRLQQGKWMVKAMRTIIKGNINGTSSEIKCTTKCVLQTYGAMDANGAINPETLRKLVGRIPDSRLKTLAVNSVEMCTDDAESIEDPCEKSANVLMCVARSGMLTLTNLPKTILDGVQFFFKNQFKLTTASTRS